MFLSAADNRISICSSSSRSGGSTMSSTIEPIVNMQSTV